MRLSGHAAGAGGLGRSDHLCWAFKDRAELMSAGLDFLRGGLASGQRLMYVTGRTVEEMGADLAVLEGVDGLIASGALQLVRVPDIYDMERPLDPPAQLATYAAELERALSDGFTGMRVLADPTDLVRDPARRPAHVQFEHLADEFMSCHPVSALCAYDVSALGEDVVAEIASVHPLVHGPHKPFQVFFGEDRRLTLAGEIDSFVSDDLESLLASSHVAARSHILIDVSGLRFIDGRGLHALARFGKHMAERGGEVRVAGASELVCRVWRTLRFDEVPGIQLVGQAA